MPRLFSKLCAGRQVNPYPLPSRCIERPYNGVTSMPFSTLTTVSQAPLHCAAALLSPVCLGVYLRYFENARIVYLDHLHKEAPAMDFFSRTLAC